MTSWQFAHMQSLSTESLGCTTPIERTRWPCDNVVITVILALNPEAFPLKITISLFSAQNNFARRWPLFLYRIYRMEFKSNPAASNSIPATAVCNFQWLLFLHQMGCLQYSLIWKRRNWGFLLSLNVCKTVCEWMGAKKVSRVFQWQTEI